MINTYILMRYGKIYTYLANMDKYIPICYEYVCTCNKYIANTYIYGQVCTNLQHT